MVYFNFSFVQKMFLPSVHQWRLNVVCHVCLMLFKKWVFITKSNCDDILIIIVKYIFQFCNIANSILLKYFSMHSIFFAYSITFIWSKCQATYDLNIFSWKLNSNILIIWWYGKNSGGGKKYFQNHRNICNTVIDNQQIGKKDYP